MMPFWFWTVPLTKPTGQLGQSFSGRLTLASFTAGTSIVSGLEVAYELSLAKIETATAPGQFHPR
jgi:hypothetical protein